MRSATACSTPAWRSRSGGPTRRCRRLWRRCGNFGVTPVSYAPDHGGAASRRSAAPPRIAARPAAVSPPSWGRWRRALVFAVAALVLRWHALVPWAVLGGGGYVAGATGSASSTAGRPVSARCCCSPPSSRTGRSSTTRRIGRACRRRPPGRDAVRSCRPRSSSTSPSARRRCASGGGVSIAAAAGVAAAAAPRRRLAYWRLAVARGGRFSGDLQRRTCESRCCRSRR